MHQAVAMRKKTLSMVSGMPSTGTLRKYQHMMTVAISSAARKAAALPFF
jgi:hypothetical protein